MNTLDRVLAAAQQAGVKLWAEGRELRFRAPKGALGPELRAALQSRRTELIALLEATEGGSIPRSEDQEDYPLSPAQRRLWLLAQMDTASPAYHIPLALLLVGAVDRVALASALSAVVRRHESLRTVFISVEGEPRQRVLPGLEIALAEHDLSGQADPERAARTWLKAEAARPFELERGPLLRVALLRLASERWVLSITLHHIVADGVSLSVLAREVAWAYEAARRGIPPVWKPLAIQGRDYAVWQHARLAGPAMAAHRTYWLEKLAGVPPAADLPADRPRPAQQTFRGRIHAFRLGAPGLRRLHELARAERSSLFMVLVALVKVLLREHIGRDDLAVASPVAGRDHADLEGQIGFYLNTLVLRDRIDSSASFRALLRSVRASALEAYDHQAYPFDQLVGELGLPRDLSRAPLCDVVVMLQNTGDLRLTLTGAAVRAFPFDPGISKFDLTFDFQEGPDGLEAGLEYNSDLFEADRIERLAAQFEALAAKAASDPDRPIDRLEILPEAERKRVLEEFNATGGEWPRATSAVAGIEAQVARTPTAPAVVGEAGESLTYAELNARANRLARHLRDLGARPGTRVGVCLERSPGLVAVLLAVWKAGAAYVPLDPAFPRERLAFMLEDSEAGILIADGAVEWPVPPGVALVRPGAEGREGPPPVNPPAAAGPEDAAYVIYTSGSTGRPKGVQVRHRGLLNFLLSMREAPGLAARDTLLAVTTLSFDIAGLELWLPLLVGARIVLARRETAGDGAALLDLVRSSGATVLQATPATWRMLLAAGWEGTPGLRILCGGEALPGDLAARLLPRGAEVWNLYGPTETTVWSTLHRVGPDEAGGTVPIGRPIANTRCYVVGRGGGPAPIGVPGELWIGGDGLAAGYWRRPELTAEKFTADPFASEPGARVYRTGDLARWRADGSLEFLGRGDGQVKLRGYRIELGEIEAALSAHPEVGAAAAVLRSDASGDPRLAAYLVARRPDSPPDPAALRAWLRERLPEYMVPTAWRTLAALPLTANGKVDRRALPEPEAELRTEAGRAAPRDAAERQVAAIWSEVLGVSDLGIDDDFFERGGHSLKATMAIARLRRAGGGDLALVDLFRHPTVAGFAKLLGVGAREAVPAAAPEAAPEAESLSAAQRRLWIIEQMRPGLPVYTMPEALRIEGPLDRTALRLALRALVERHESLRTTFAAGGGEPRQLVGPAEAFALKEIDLSGASDPEAQARAAAQAAAAAAFDLERGPLFRASLLRLGAERHVLLCTMHHIVSDAWSVGVLFGELGRIYGAFAAGRANPLPAPAARYADFARWQNRELSEPAVEVHREYWLRRLGGEPVALALPTDFPRPAVQTASGLTHVFSLGRELSAALARVGRTEGATPFMTLLALVKALLARHTGQRDIAVGTPVAGRDRVEWEGVVGFLVNTLVLRDTVEPAESFAELLRRVRASCSDAFEHQAYPFDRLVEDLKLDRDLSRPPLFDVSVQLQERAGPATELPGLAVTPFAAGQAPAKCDLSFDFADTPGGFACALTYNPDLFLPGRIDRMGRHLVALAEAAVAGPALPLGRLPLMAEAERKRVLEEFNPPAAPAAERSALEGFSHWARLQPDHPAVLLDGLAWSYRELDRRSNRLANVLRQRCVRDEARVGVLLERGREPYLAILAILKAGGVYVPLDPRHPAERLRLMIEDSGANLIIAQRSLEGLCPVRSALAPWEDLIEEAEKAPEAPPTPTPVPGQGAYLIYTSGSTGVPKGVLVEHRGLANTMADQAVRLEMRPADRVLQFASCSFDASVFEIFLALSSGATLVPAPASALADSREFLRHLRTNGVTLAVLPPSFLRSLDQAELPLRILFTAGESPWPRDVEHYRGRLTYVNGYGPTEASICSTAYLVPPAAPLANGVPIGAPLAGTQVRILDDELQPVPIGVEGEICVGGAGLARGYWRRPDLTAEKFIADPFSAKLGGRLYRTGDRGRWREDGMVEFFGRSDGQVKLRGFRIELGEIESALVSHPGVREAAVMRREDSPGVAYLAGYVVPRSRPGPASGELRAHLAARLPDHMLPSAFVELAALPVNAAGKVDRRALPAPEGEEDGPGSGPRTELEAAVAAVFRDVLRREGAGREENFFHLGGNSLLAIQAIARLRNLKRGEVSVLEFFAHPTIAGLASRLARGEGDALPSIQARPAGGPPELSFAQQRLWFIQQLDPGSPAYNITAAVRLEGELDISRLESALNEILRRHEALRTSFPAEDGRASARVAPQLALRLEAEDLGPASDRDAAVRRRIRREAGRPFDLGQAPLLRLAILHAAPREHVAVLTMHHIVSDGLSMEILIRELTELYAGRTLPELAIQYSDFAAWQREWLQGENLERSLEYWRRRLSHPPVLTLPIDRARPARPSLAGATRTFVLPAEVARGLRGLAREEDATLFMVLLAGFQALLHRLSGQEDLAVGMPVASRGRTELEPLIGFFVNTLVIRTDVSPSADFRSLLGRAKRTVLEALDHQEVPFEKLVQELQPERSLSQTPLFQAMFSLQPTSREVLRLPGLSLTALPSESSSAKFDLTLALEESGEEIFGALEYSTELFVAETAGRFVGRYAELLRAVAGGASAPIGELPIFLPREESLLVGEWSGGGVGYGEEGMGERLSRRFEERAGEVAVSFGGKELKYGELEERSNRLARRLVELGVGAEVLVPVYLERSLELIVVLVAVIKAGGAYVALDPEYPPERLALMVGEAKGPVVVTEEKLLGRWPGSAGSLLVLERAAGEIGRQSAEALLGRAGLENLAYVSYTSGSTGRPKGVAVKQRGVVRLVEGTDFAELGAGESFLQLAPVAFDASTLEIWAPLLNGGRLVVAPPGTPSLEELGRLLRQEKVTTLWLTSGLFQLMVEERLEDLAGLRQLLAGGDVLPVSTVRRVLRELPGLRLINGYGPTENTTFTCCHTIREEDLEGGSVPIGRPIANTKVYLLDAAMKPVPVGFIGELYAGGDGVARGYLGDEKLTGERFVANPFGPGKLYRTGDLGRWRGDGVVEFLGRADRQVKIRGYRIEPGEVEAALLAEPGVKAAAVTVHEANGRKRLVAYVSGSVSGPELLLRLRRRLPEHLVPSACMVLEALPLNANGKIERSALPEPSFEPEPQTDAAPAEGLEADVAAIWSAVLGIGQIGANDNYFSLGGDSITAIQVASRLKKAGRKIEVRDIFEHPTVAALARKLAESGPSAGAAEEEEQAGPVPLTPAQAWFFERYREERHHFNQAVLLRAPERLDPAAVRASCGELWRHHDALRSVFRIENGAVSARILEVSAEPSFEFVDLASAADPEQSRLAHTERAQADFDLAAGPLFKAVLYRLPQEDRLLLLAHHLVVDGVSWRILLEDMETLLGQHEAGRPLELGPKTGSVRRWAEAAARDDGAEAGWWNQQAALASRVWPQPAEGASNCFGGARTIEQSLEPEPTRSLLTAANRAYQTGPNDLLLTALARAIRHRQGGGPVRLTLEGHGRDEAGGGPAIERTVGWFTSLFPVVLPVAGGDACADLREVKEALRSVPRNGVGYGRLAFLRAPGERPAGSSAAWPAVSFNYLGQIDAGGGGRLAFADESTGSPIGAGVQRQHEVDVGAAVLRGRMNISVTYHPGRLAPAEAEGLLADFRRELETLAAAAGRAPEKTPSDFTSRVLDLKAYDRLLSSRGWNAAAVEDVCRLSPMQSGLLFQSIFDAGSTAYFVQMAYRVRGDLRPDLFARAWAELARRHAILRTSFVHEGQPVPFQVVWRERQPETAFADLRGRSVKEQEEAIAAHRRSDLSRGFELEADPLVRVALFQLAADRFQVIWSYHHALLDGWSLGLVYRDFQRISTALAAGRPPVLPAPAPYRDYVRWLEGRDPEESRKFWTKALGGYERTASVPRVVRPQEGVPADPAEMVVDLGPELSARLRESAAALSVTLATLLQTAWGVILARYNRTDDAVFGSVVSGRPPGLPGVEDMVGLFICAVPMRIRLRPGQTFAEVARETQAAALAAEAHHHLPTAEIQSLTPLGGDLFDHVVIVENTPADREIAGPDGGSVEAVEAHDRTHYDFDLTVVPGDTVVLKLGHNRHVHPEAQAAQIAGHLRTMLAGIAADPSRPADELPLLAPGEERRILEEFNATEAAWPRDATLTDLLEEQERASPDAPAVIAAGETLTYRELHRRANRLARRLRRMGVGAETPVGLCVERSAAMFVGVLGIWKAGGAYVPLDPLYPPERLAFMLEDSGAAAIVTESAYAGKFATARIDLDGEEVRRVDPAAPSRASRPDHLAYIIYTSGSTGRPKGVMVEHRSLVNAAGAWRLAYGLEALSGPMLQMASLSFDVFAGDLVRALTNGGCLVVCDSDTRLDPAGLCDLLARHRVGLFESTPGLILPLMEHARSRPADLAALRVLILGSDTLPADEYRRLAADFGRGRRLINSYGVTEATIDSCFYEDAQGEPGPGAAVPVGRPMANTRAYVLDERRAPVPVGVAGELYLAGEGLARGYRNRPELTAERFVEAEVAGRRQRLYRTGDLARWLPSGDLEFLGRADDQVKVRGFRVELGEIEARLRAHPAVREAAVAAIPRPGGCELAAYVVAPDSWDPAALRAHLLAALPEPMAPRHWIRLERLPLSPNGKVDRRALPAPSEEDGRPEADFIAPRTPDEEKLAAIWREVLQVERVGVRDNFFELGGHSLKAMQVISRIQQEWGVKPRMRDFFREPTIAALAAQLGAAPARALESIPPAPPSDDYELSYAQQRLWLLHRLGGASAYNMPEAYVFETAIDADALEQAFRRLVARHEALRTAFIEVEGEPRQRIRPGTDFSLKRLDLAGDPRAEARAREIADREAVEPFDLTRPPLLRATLIALGPRRAILLFTMHHIVGDGWSGNVLSREVLALYAAARRGAPDPLLPLRIHYKDFSVWQKGRSFGEGERFWLAKLAGMPPAIALPYDFAPSPDRDFRGDAVRGEIDAATAAGLRRLATGRRTTLANAVLALFQVLLFRLTKQDDLCVGVSVAGRNHPDLENLVGFFVNILPIRVRMDEAMEFDQLLVRVAAAAEEAFEHQDTPFDLLVQRLNPARAANRQPLLNVVYAFQNFADVHVAGAAPAADGGEDLAPARAFAHAFRTSKFDLTLFVSDDGGKLLLTLEYDTGLFREQTARRYLDLLGRFAAAAAAS